ncbi:MAG: heme-copper oxidase subunit III [Bacteriovoracaceae bacterium]
MNTKAEQYEAFKNSVAMTVTLVSFSMLFFTLFLGYALVRFNSPMWPPVEIQGMPRMLPLLSTLVMIFSSVTYFLFEKKNSALLWLATVALGLVFLALQWTLWSELKATGILVGNGMVPSMVYAYTWLHAGHIVLALLALLWIGWLLKKGTVTQAKLTNVGKFWHFLGAVWIVMYLTLFVL